MRKYINGSIAILLILLLITAISIIIIQPTYIPRRLRPPNRNHRLETMRAMGSWAFVGTTYSDCDSRFYRPTLRQVRQMYRRFERGINGDVIYPDFYGGIAVNGPRLTLLIVEHRLEEAKAHDAFTHLFTENHSYRFVEFSFAQLLETRALAIAAIDARQGCFYADNAREVQIHAPDNRVHISLVRNYADFEWDMNAGFREYVFESPMVITFPTIFLPIGVRFVHPLIPFSWIVVFVCIPLGIVLLIKKRHVIRISENHVDNLWSNRRL